MLKEDLVFDIEELKDDKKKEDTFDNINKKDKLYTYRKEIEEEVNQFLLDNDYAYKTSTGYIQWKSGACHIAWKYEKQLLKERYDIDWLTPDEQYPNILFD